MVLVPGLILILSVSLDDGTRTWFYVDSGYCREARHQLFYLELKRIATQVWKHSSGVECRQIGVSFLDCEDLLANLFRALPFIHKR